MTKIMYCRYCRRNVPMLDDDEFALVAEIHRKCVEAVKNYRRQHNVTLAETPLDELYRPVRESIQQITQTADFEIDEVLRRHRTSRWQKKAVEPRTEA